MECGPGIDTTASLLTSALYLLARHPGIERRLHADVDTVLAGCPPAYEDLLPAGVDRSDPYRDAPTLSPRLDVHPDRHD
ncbi:cytochrome P450 [Streptomyces roseifaciens]|uniref:cytochrome P450 n=1 Tax=Streptomyces roseifaciens TaxID=1488406 RepID=UPI0023B928FA|nr:cytochrome P450 [Streptomyces roseifaciens]